MQKKKKIVNTHKHTKSSIHLLNYENQKPEDDGGKPFIGVHLGGRQPEKEWRKKSKEKLKNNDRRREKMCRSLETKKVRGGHKRENHGLGPKMDSDEKRVKEFKQGSKERKLWGSEI